MKHTVYLAGPITGKTYAGATQWRTLIARDLESSKVECRDPMRGKSFLQSSKEIKKDGYTNVIASSKGVTRRDYNDVVTASCLFVNLLDAQKVSIGTVMEIAWAYQARVPTVVVMEQDNPHRHLMIEEACHYIVDNLVEAVNLVKNLLNDCGNESPPNETL